MEQKEKLVRSKDKESLIKQLKEMADVRKKFKLEQPGVAMCYSIDVFEGEEGETVTSFICGRIIKKYSRLKNRMINNIKSVFRKEKSM